MKNNRVYLIGLFVIVICSKASAQTVAELSTLKAPVAPITVDANLAEWGDSLKYYSEDTGERFAFTNDKDNIYFAIKLEDLAQAMRVLKAGLTLSIDPKGKKKPSYSITFPVNTQPGTVNKPLQTNSLNGVTQADRDELHRELITSLRGIKVEGFNQKDIEGDMITTSNTYGIKTAIDYDAKGNLICEAAIPLKFFSIDGKSKSEWSFDVKMNAISNQPAKSEGDGKVSSNFGGGGGRNGGGGGMGGGRGGMGGGRGGRGGQGGQTRPTQNDEEHGGLNKPVEFSGKFALAVVQ